MDAKFLRLATLTVFAFSAACAKKGSSQIDPEAKQHVLSSASALQLKKAYCLPNPILDEEDIVPLLQDGYKLSTEDNYCIPEADGSFDFGDYNCVPYKFVDQYDRVYLLDNEYRDTGTEYCNDKPDDGNNGGDGETTAGGSTTSDSTNGGSTTSDSTTGGGSTTSDSTNGGSTNSDSGNTSGSVTGGSDGGGTTSDSTNGGGSVTGGSTNTSGGSDTGGATTSDSTNGGSTTSGSVNGGGSDTGGATTSDSTNGGSTTAGSTIGTTVGGSDTGGATTSDTNGGSTNSSTNGGTTGSTSGGDTNGSTTGGSDNGSTNGSTTGGSTNGSCHDDHEWKAPIDRLCSKIRTGNGKYILKNRAELVVQVLHRVKDKKTRKMVSTLVCESKDTAKIKDDILNKHRVDLDDCNLHNYKRSELFLTIFSPVVSKDLPISTYDYMYVRFFKKGSDVNGKEELSFLNYGSRENRYVPLSEKIMVIVNNNPDNSNVSNSECDAKASPLIVHVNPEHDVPKYVELTAIDDGVKFDILGLNSEPAPYVKKQISWLANDQYMFLVLPNKQGKVVGVDQMFGDNTFGPDKDFAPNGFLALAKYDSNRDGVIDSDDGVFKKLRLWNDDNRDGIGTPDEMHSLASMKVQVIDLRYDASFREKDRYGNETVYKSVIMYDDGSLDLIFDLWFNYKK